MIPLMGILFLSMTYIQLYFEKEAIWKKIFALDAFMPFAFAISFPSFVEIFIGKQSSNIEDGVLGIWLIIAFWFYYSRYKTRIELWQLQKWLLKVTENKKDYEKENLDEILLDVEEIHTFTKQTFITKKRFYIKIMNVFLSGWMNIYINWHIDKLLGVLKNIQKNLIDHLNEQKSILQSAKSEVDKNLTGNPELLAVSEAQKLRLDRQIEQFEELQKRLVKI